MVVRERGKMEASACNGRNGWRSNADAAGRCVRADSVDDAWASRVPVIVPCYNGKSLRIHEELVVNGLSAISIKHHRGNCSDTVPDAFSEVGAKPGDGSGKEPKEMKGRTSKVSVDGREGAKKRSLAGLPVCLGERMKRRNSFWNMHRPELSKLTWPHNFISSAMLQDFFHHHLRIHGTFCEPLHVEVNRSQVLDEEVRDYTVLRELVPPTALPPDEKAVNIMEKSRSVQLNDEDLDPEIRVHKSRAEFCVTIGEYVRRSLLKRSASHRIPKMGPQSAGRFESLPIHREGFLSREDVNYEELVSCVISNPAAPFPVRSRESRRGKSSDAARISSSRDDAAAVPAEDPGSANAEEQVADDSGDPARLRTILSPRDEGNSGGCEQK